MKTRLLINGRHYHTVVSGASLPVLLLHGFGGDVHAWRNLRAVLEPCHQVIALDILGHGGSDKPASAVCYRMENVADDIIALLDKLEVGRLHLLGYSMGGRLALYLALRLGSRRFRSLILASASPGLYSQQERDERICRDHHLADQIEANGIAWFVDFWEGLPLWNTPTALPVDVLAAQRRQRLGNHPVGLANSLRGMGSGAQPSLWDELLSLKMPVQLIVGEHDRKFLRINREMAALIPQATMQIIPDAGHRVHLDNPPLFQQAVISFLRSH